MPQTIPTPLGGTGTADPLVPPSGDDTGSIGQVANRWADVYASKTTTGDLDMLARDGSAHWSFVEKPDHIEVINRKTGQSYVLMLQEKSP